MCLCASMKEVTAVQHLQYAEYDRRGLQNQIRYFFSLTFPHIFVGFQTCTHASTYMTLHPVFVWGGFG